jgi:preprotein translocase subunit SecA
MEGLRVSIGLEAYAQRDPLVQYKNKAFELYQELLSNVRLSVLSRMFKYRPQATPASIATPATRISQIEAPAVVDSSQENLPKQAREPAAVQQATKQERKKRQKMSTSQKRRRSRKR